MSWVAVAIGGSALLGAGTSMYAANKQAKGANAASQVQQNMFDQTKASLQPWEQSGGLALSQINKGLGISGGANSRDNFDADAYLAANPDVAKAGIDPYQHFIQYGRSEGRQFTPLGQGQGGSGVTEGMFTKPFGMDQFQESPAYQFNLAEGEKAINKAANARGNYYAPQTLQDLGKFSQGLASNEFQNAYSNYNNSLNNIYSKLYGQSASGQNAAAQTGGFGQNAANQIGNNITGAANAGAAGAVGASNAISGGAADAYNNYLLSSVMRNQQPTYGGGNTGGTFGGS